MNDTRVMIQFITDSLHTLKKHNITCEFINKKQVEFGDGTVACGYFDEKESKIAIAIGKPLEVWFDVFVHEYCHFEQWTEGIELWDKCLYEGEEVLDRVMQHFNGDLKLSKKLVNDYIHFTAQLEKDCEMRVLDKAVKCGLPIDPKDYARAANSYVVFYYAMKEFKRWYKEPPYDFYDILDVMPDHMEGVDHKALADEHIELFRECCL